MSNLRTQVNVFVNQDEKYPDLNVYASEGVYESTSKDAHGEPHMYIDIHTTNTNVSFFFTSMEDVMKFHAAISKSAGLIEVELQKQAAEKES